MGSSRPRGIRGGEGYARVNGRNLLLDHLNRQDEAARYQSGTKLGVVTREIVTRLVEKALFKICVIESAILTNRSSKTCAVLRLRERKRQVHQRVCRVQTLVSKVTTKIAMQRVSAAFR